MSGLELVCVPFAGAGAGIFRRWRTSKLAGIRSISAVQLRGREERFREPPATAMSTVVSDCLEQIRPATSWNQVVLFGHSFGALVAYEICREVEARLGERVRGLVVSGALAPDAKRDPLPPDLSDEEFVSRLAGLVGYLPESLSIPELRELLLPALRADLAINAGYEHRGAKAGAPILAFRGSSDALVSSDGVRRWSEFTSGQFAYHEFDGGHMYVLDAWERIWKAVAAQFSENSAAAAS